MALILRVDGDRWRSHLKDVHERHPSLVPVAKGNGYGFGLGRLARKSQWLGVDTIAVGTYEEIPQIAKRYDGSMLVLTPWRPFNPRPGDPRVIHTVGRLDDLTSSCRARHLLRLEAAGDPRRMTSMRRHGFSAPPARGGPTAEAQRRVRVEGVALHLPLAPRSQDLAPQRVERFLNDVVAAGSTSSTTLLGPLHDLVSPSPRWSSLCSAEYPDFDFRPRVGTSLGSATAGAVGAATVLDTPRVDAATSTATAAARLRVRARSWS